MLALIRPATDALTITTHRVVAKFGFIARMTFELAAAGDVAAGLSGAPPDPRYRPGLAANQDPCQPAARAGRHGGGRRRKSHWDGP